MRRGAGEIRDRRGEGLDGWMRSKKAKGWVVGAGVAAWLPLGLLVGLLPFGSLTRAYALEIWLLVGLGLLAEFLGRRRSIRSYDDQRDLVALADLLSVAVPENVVWRDEIALGARDPAHQPLVDILALVAGVGLLAVLADPLGAAGRGVGGAWATFLAWFGLLPVAAFIVSARRGQRERAFRDQVWAAAASLAAGEAEQLRHRLAQEVDELQARIDELRRLDEDLAAGVPVDIRLLAEVQRIGVQIETIRDDARLDGRYAIRRDWVLMIVGAIFGLLVSQAWTSLLDWI